MLLALATIVILLSFVAAVAIAIRHRGLLTSVMALLVGLVLLRAAAFVAAERIQPIQDMVWVHELFASELPLVLSAALCLLAVGVLAILLQRQKASDRELAETAATLQAAERSGRIGYYVYDRTLDQVVSCSREFESLFGPGAQVLGMSWADWQERVHADDREKVRGVFARSAAEAGPYDLDYRIVATDGTVRHVNESGAYFVDSAGGTGRSMGTLIDRTRMHQVEARLEESRAAIALAEEHAGFGHYVFDFESGTFTVLSHGASVILGVAPERVVGRPSRSLVDLIHPDDRPRVERTYAAASSGRTDFAVEYRHVRPDGTLRHLREVGGFLGGDRPGGGQLVGALLDVTEARRREREMRESATILATAQRIARLGTYVFDDARDAMVYVSPEFAQIHGRMEADCMVGLEASLDQVHPDDRALVLDLHRRSQERHSAYDMEYRIVLPDGRVRHVREVGEVVPDDDGEGARTIGAVMDLTEIRAAQRELEEQRTILSFAQRVAGIGHVVYDADLGRAVEVSEMAEQISGAARDEMLGHWSQDLLTVHPDDRAHVEAAYAGADRGEPFDIEYRLELPDGSVRHIQEVSQDLDAAGAAGNRQISTLRDISAQKRIEAELREAKEAAEAANEAKSRFLATMSHEIRTPMNGVLGIASLLADSPLDRQQQRYVNNLRQSAEALIAIINDILDLSKIEAGKLELQIAPLDLDDVVTSVADLLYPAASSKGLVLGAVLAGDVAPRLLGDAGRLRQILVNLVGNALKFTDSGGVVVTVDREDAAAGHVVLRFAVRDTGIGIPEAARDRLFDMFTQVDPSSGRARGGSGLGLAICRRLVGLMQGEIGFESHPGAGTTFWFTARFGLAAAAPAAVPRLAGRRFLVVDATAVGRRLIEGQLAAAGAVAVMIGPGESPPQDGPLDGVVVGHLAGQAEPAAEVRRLRALPSLAALRIVAVVPVGAAVSSSDGAAAFVPVPVHQRDLLPALLADPRRPGEDRLRRDQGPRARHDGIRILLAEDNRVNQLVAVNLLEGAGYRVDIAANGVEAVEAVQRAAYDLLLMDSSMPEMDGIEATRRIRRLGGALAQLPIVALTADALPGDRERYLEAGMSDYLPKPVRKAELLSMVDSWVVRRAQPAAR